MIKKSSLVLLLLVTCYANDYGLEAKKSSMECTGKSAKERLPLFVQAERHEQNLFHAQAGYVISHRNPNRKRLLKEAKDDALCSLVLLMNHLNELEEEKDDSCRLCEKNEAIEIKNRLIKLLLESNE